MKASLWSIFTSLPQPLMAIPAFLFVRAFEPLLPIGLGLAAGGMIWMVFAELIPDALKHATGGSVGIAVTLAATACGRFNTSSATSEPMPGACTGNDTDQCSPSWAQ